MEYNNQIYEKNEKFLKIKTLECINSEIFLFDLNIEELELHNLFNGKQSDFIEKENKILGKLTFLVDLIIKILDKTECFCRMNLFFEKLSKKISVGFLENLLCYIYSMISIKAKHLNCKKFVVNFPQIISKEFLEFYENDSITFDDFPYEKNKIEFFGNKIFYLFYFYNQLESIKTKNTTTNFAYNWDKLNNYFFISLKEEFKFHQKITEQSLFYLKLEEFKNGENFYFFDYVKIIENESK